MKALDRKLLRDLRLMWSQALTIALVVASGIGGFITTLSAVDSLALARDRFYASGRFAAVFAAIALWNLESWAWPLAMVIGIVGLLSSIVALVYSRQLVLIVGIVLCVAAVVALLPRSVRTSYRI